MESSFTDRFVSSVLSWFVVALPAQSARIPDLSMPEPVRRAFESGDIVQSVAECNKLKAKLPPAAWRELMAVCYAHSYWPRTGVEHAEQLVLLKPGNARALATLAFTYAIVGEWARAERTATRALAIDPANARALAVLGIAGRMNGLTRGDAALEKAVKLSPGDFNIQMLLSRKADEVLDEDPGKMGFDQFVKLHPGSAYAYALKASYEREHKNMKVALADAARALSLNPRLTEARVIRAGISRELNQFQQAIDDYNFIQNGGAPCLIEMARGECYRKTKQYARAEKDYRGAMGYLESLARNRKGQFDFNLLDQKMRGNYKECWLTRIEMLAVLGRNDEAASEIKRFRMVDPTNIGILHLSQRVNKSRGRYSEAVKDIDTLIAGSPSVAEYYRWRASALGRMGLKADEKLDLKRADSLDKYGSLEPP